MSGTGFPAQPRIGQPPFENRQTIKESNPTSADRLSLSLAVPDTPKSRTPENRRKTGVKKLRGGRSGGADGWTGGPEEIWDCGLNGLPQEQPLGNSPGLLLWIHQPYLCHRCFHRDSGPLLRLLLVLWIATEISCWTRDLRFSIGVHLTHGSQC